ncbi:hypothetical protein [Phosphitispora fastidiosa]|uniref:hypothetical protein n=1 Tax=Phosphitispora fastidiosa TaxID=2837202 RepID=UPI001E42A062|nr:hypothetical protein [Phosphitispora fastidiosa]MBU7007812.1 hypothetical protein [Phosphitispora fastidiosa]
MTVGETKKMIVFPRIPLKLNLPSGYPKAGKISNISIAPEISEYRVSRSEMEIKGSYQITVSYFQACDKEDQTPPELKEVENDDFFCHLRLQADGLFVDEEDDYSGNTGLGAELYTVHYTRPFHTFVDIQLIERPRQYKPGMIVEKADLTSDGSGLSGELVLGLVNRARRRSW